MAIIWSVLVLIIMASTIKYYLPVLSARISNENFKTLENSEQNDLNDQYNSSKDYLTKDMSYQNCILKNRKLTVLMIVLCAVIAGFCGYKVQTDVNSWNNVLKITMVMAVLSCIFITDLELFIIPNSCVLILCLGRVILVVAEFIWMRQQAGILLFNSIAATIIILVFLSLMSVLTKGGIGMGDVKILSGIGFMLGIQTVCYSMVMAFFSLSLISLILLVTKNKQLKDSLPLGPFIWLGYMGTVFLTI